MHDDNLANVKAHQSELVQRVEAGETVQMKRRKPVAEIVPIRKPNKPADVAQLNALRASQPRQEISAGDFVHQIRDTDRY
ncbi:type II toxin-antitoxin system prevent-host-death family antitoxin [Rhizobium sp. 007]|uniref:type II toxin-antitoxin system Phd/YefM family antitoxin n=1 Tax=Rhizobium sp. 007 TaxID=2785056 RepID=UPI00188ED0FA|nr:type II toxin-antitoxin system prevent-host-death family antitoxin [Rhizobium sp. 007]QPB24128.1 type II toxin-antitoxin system prevent-host-death family antitoxin [Rhizobium sp. 007]